MDLLAPVKRFDRYQQKHRVPAVAIAVLKKFSDDQAGGLAALVAYYALLSLFPLLLVFTTILGFMLSGEPGALRSVEDSVLGRFPLIGESLKGERITGNVTGLVLGIVFSMLAGLGVTQAAGRALDEVWGVPRQERPDFFMSRLRGLIVLLSLGAIFIVASGVSGVVSGGLGGPVLQVAGYVFSILLNFALFLVSFKVLCTAELSWEELVPGALLAAIIWTILQAVGGVFINHIRNSGRYGTFALVIGIMLWLHLGAQLTLYAVELNSVLARKLWPRKLFGEESPPSAARRAPQVKRRDAA